MDKFLRIITTKCFHGKCFEDQYVTIIRYENYPVFGMPTLLCASYKEVRKWLVTPCSAVYLLSCLDFLSKTCGPAKTNQVGTNYT